MYRRADTDTEVETTEAETTRSRPPRPPRPHPPTNDNHKIWVGHGLGGCIRQIDLYSIDVANRPGTVVLKNMNFSLLS
jgi:hypothetical protein